LRVVADKLLSELNPDECDLFLIPGGEPKLLIKNPEMKEHVSLLNKILQDLNQKGKKIAAICGGPTFLANSGILDGKKCTASISEEENEYYKNSLLKNEDIIQDGNILTSQGQAFTEFAIEVSKMLNLFENESEALNMLNWFRNKKE
jgi:protein deglycase